MSKFQNKTKQKVKKKSQKLKLHKMVTKRQQNKQTPKISPLISSGGSFELFSKDGISVFYTIDKLPSNRLGYHAHFYSIDNDYEYTPFCHDFGPPNLFYIYQFCNKLTARINSARMKRIYLYSSKSKEKLSNGLLLVGCYLMINYPKLIRKFLKNISSLSLAQFRDALSSIDPIRTVSVEDCLKGFKIALNLKWFSLSTFDPISYEYNAQVERGDINWIVPNKFIAFMGPLNTSSICEYYGFPLYTPEDHLNYFRSINVKSVIRLNEICYDKSKFTRNSINHFDLIFPDNSVPPLSIVEQFLEIVEREPGVIAVHCKQGLGRTGTLIACYLIKHFSFTARQATAYIRLCRPGSVIAIQQSFLERIEESLRLSKTTNCKIVEKSIVIPQMRKRKIIKVKSLRKVVNQPTRIPNKPQKRKRLSNDNNKNIKRKRLSNSPLIARKCK